MSKYNLIDTFFEILNQKKENEKFSDDLYVKSYEKFLKELFVSNNKYDIEKILDVMQYVKENYDVNIDKTKFLRKFIFGLKDKNLVKKYLNNIEEIVDDLSLKLRSIKFDLPANWVEKYGVILTKNEIEKIKSKYSISSSKNNPKKLTSEELGAYKTLINEMIKKYGHSLSELLRIAKTKSNTTFNELGIKYEEILKTSCPELFEYIDVKINEEKNILLTQKKEAQKETLKLKQEISYYKDLVKEIKEKFNIQNSIYSSDNSERNTICGGGGCWG